MEPDGPQKQKAYWWRLAVSELKANAGHAAWTEAAASTPSPGDICPTCGRGVLSYDGLFLLTCNQCGQVAESGCFT